MTDLSKPCFSKMASHAPKNCQWEWHSDRCANLYLVNMSTIFADSCWFSLARFHICFVSSGIATRKPKPAPKLGHTPSTAGTFRRKFRKYSGKNPEMLSELFLDSPRNYGWDPPKPYNSRHLKPPEYFQNWLPSNTAWDAPFSEVVPERASQSCSWSSQQY